jgi:hypothetical protein
LNDHSGASLRDVVLEPHPKVADKQKAKNSQ